MICITRKRPALTAARVLYKQIVRYPRNCFGELLGLFPLLRCIDKAAQLNLSLERLYLNIEGDNIFSVWELL